MTRKLAVITPCCQGVVQILYSYRVDTVLRIGELSKRSGVSPELLRAWERRYGLLQPTRSAGGLRLYSLDDLERVRQMQTHLEGGLAAAEAAALVSRPSPPGEVAAPVLLPESALRELADALDDFDEPRAQAVIDRLLALATVDALLTDVVLPYLHELGERWKRGEASIAQEHFASSVIRGRLLGLARSWGGGLGPLALLACLPGEQHDLGLIAFGLALRARGWRIAYLGTDTPLETLDGAARSLAPALVVVTAATPERVSTIADELRELAERHRLALGGNGADGAAEIPDALVLTGDPVAAADHVTAVIHAAVRR
jgi:MerR family transcriptional regulator, light-induced transcriptional regulator